MPPADVDALYANLEDHYAYLARMPGSEYHRDADVAWFVSGRTENFFNAVVSAAFEPTAAARRVDEVLRPFVDRGIPVGRPACTRSGRSPRCVGVGSVPRSRWLRCWRRAPRASGSAC